MACRELTKTHEEIRRGTLGELTSWSAGDPLGEITLVVAGAPGPARVRPGEPGSLTGAGVPTLDEAVAAVAAREAAGTPRKLAIAAVAREAGLPKREVYNAVVGAGRPR